jgi:calcium-dependent protein kinase
LFVFDENFVLQDGQIDYGEFAAMMRKGNGGIGRRTMTSTLNFRDALGIIGNGSN